jgi:hypothetical protein
VTAACCNDGDDDRDKSQLQRACVLFSSTRNMHTCHAQVHVKQFCPPRDHKVTQVGPEWAAITVAAHRV